MSETTTLDALLAALTAVFGTVACAALYVIARVAIENPGERACH